MDPQAPPPRPRRFRVRWRWVLTGVALTAVLALAGLFPQEPLRRLAEEALRRATSPASRLGRLRLAPALLRLQIDGLELRGSGYTVVIPRGHVRFAARSLWTRSVSLRTLELDGVRVELAPALKGGTTGEPSPTALAALAGLRVDRVSLEHAAFVLRMEGGASVEVDEIRASGSFGKGRLEIAAMQGRWREREGRTLTFGPARAVLDTAAGLDATLASFEVEAGTSRLSARGPLLQAAAWAPDLELRGDLDLVDAARRLDLGPVSGRLALAGRLARPRGSWRLETRFEGSGGWQSTRTEGLRVEATYDGERRRAELSLAGRAFGGRLEGQASLAGGRSRGQIALREIALEKLTGAGDLRGSGDLEVTWTGPLAGALEIEARLRAVPRRGAWSGRATAVARGQARPRARSVDLTWEAEGLAESSAQGRPELRLALQGTARGPLPPQVSGQIAGGLEWREATARRRLDLSGSLETRGDQAFLDVEARGEPGLVRAKARIAGARLGEASLRAEGLDLAPLVAGLKGAATVDLRAAGPLRRPAVSLQGTVQGLAWRGASLGELRAQADGDPGRLAFELTLPELAARTKGEWRSGPRTRLNGVAHLDGTLLERLSPFLVPAGQEPVAGQVSAELTYDLDPGRPASGAFAAAVSSLRIQRRDVSLLASPFKVALTDGRVTLDDLVAEGPGLRLDASGSAGLGAAEPLDLRTHVELDLAALPLREPTSLRGRLQAELVLAGSRARPDLRGSIRLSTITGRLGHWPELRIDQAEVLLRGDRIAAEGIEAKLGEGSAHLSGSVPFAAVLKALRHGTLAEADESRIALRFEGVRVDRLDGPLAGELTIEGGLASIAEPRARLELPATRLRVEGQELELPATTLRLERGRLTAEGLTLRGEAGDLAVTGFADLAARSLDVTGRGRLDLRFLSALLAETAVAGTAEVDIRLDGPLAAPRPRGSLRVHDGSLRLRSLPQAVTGIAGLATFTAAGAEIDATGSLGGGSLGVKGSLALAGKALGETRLAITGRDVALRYPAGMRSRLDALLTLGGRAGSLTLAGDVVAQRGSYDLDAALEQALIVARSRASESSTLRAIGLDVRLRLARPLPVRSSLGSVEAQGQLVLRGDMQEPLPFGRLQIRPGGRLELQGRTFLVSDGSLTYAGTWNPEIALRGETSIRDPSGVELEFRVAVQVRGNLEEPQLTFSSEPELSQPEIVRLVVTGQRQDSEQAGLAEQERSDLGSSAWLLGGQAGALLAGRLTNRVARRFGLDQISIRPDLIAQELDPSARFTFGKDVGRHLGILYSAGLGGPERRFVQVEARPGLDVSLKVQRTDAGAFTYAAGQRFGWGGSRRREEKDEAKVRLTDVRLEGAPLPDGLARAVALDKGDRASAWRVQEEAERLRRWLRQRRFLEAEVGAQLEGGVAVISVTAGPRFSWRVEGWTHPPDLDPDLRDALFEDDALERGQQRLLRHLHSRGHWRARVEATTEAGQQERVLLFTVSAGPRYRDVAVRFPGAKALSERELLEAAGGVAALVERPKEAAAAVAAAYRARHHLAAKVDPPRLDERGDRLAIVVPIEEGREARLTAVRFEGTTLPEAELRKAVRLETGLPVADAALTKAAAGLRALYLARGYADVRLRPRLLPEGEDLALLLVVEEGPRRTIGEIVVSGNTRTRGDLVRRALRLRPGRPLDPRALARAERRLYDLGVFSRVAITPRAGAGGILDVQVEEGQRLTAAYDLRWSDLERASGLVEGELRNLFGTGLAIGARQRFGGTLRETRGTLHLPSLVVGGDLTGSLFRNEQELVGGDITRLARGFQLQQSLRLRGGLEVYAGYRYKRTSTRAATLIGDPIDSAGFNVSLVQTTYDSLLDPTEGRFLSVNLELDPRWLGSDAPFVKGFAQLALARSFAARSLTWAQGVRFGLARASGGEPVHPFERFLVGGANSLRGFGTDQVGPRTPLGDPAGGEAVFVLNEELRYRHRSGLGAVLFYDAGNVYARPGELGFGLRHSLGTGLRWASPVGLLRFDVGFPVDRLPGEKSYRLFFSLGQAF